ncbi:hypothetical protein F4774DRAFT_411148 [Daldinia eschscholtzii]|nr:hypothetical protein F4774DRAFT_411148 [Daldinia eschscholtzii]
MDNLSHLESQSSPHDVADSNQSAGNGVTTFSRIRDRVYTALKQSLGGLVNGSTEDSQCDIPQYITTNIKAYPRGYPRLAALATLDKEYLIVRRFSYLHARVLLDLQDRLQAYERDLNQRDREDRHNNAPAERTYNIRSIQQIDLLKRIEETLKRYRTMMDYASFPQREPSETNIENLIRFCRKYIPVTNEEEEYYLYKEDLVSLKSREETTRVDKFIAKLLYRKPHKLVKKIFVDANDLKVSDVEGDVFLRVKAKMAYDLKDKIFYWKVRLPGENKYRTFRWKDVARLPS